MAITFSTPLITITGGKETGTCPTSGSHTTTNIVIPSGAGGSNAFANRFVWIHTGTNAGVRRLITASTATSLTVDYALPAVCDNTSQFVVSFNLPDVQTADTAGGWGVTTTTGQHVKIAANTQFGDGTTKTAFGDVRKSVEWVYPAAVTDSLQVKVAAVIQFGAEKGDALPYAGCRIAIDASATAASNRETFSTNAGPGGDVCLYDCLGYFIPPSGVANFMRFQGVTRINGTRWVRHQGGRFYNADTIVRKVTAHDGTIQAFSLGATPTEMSDLEIYSGDRAFKMFSTFSGELTAAYFHDNTKTIYIESGGTANVSGTLTLTDCLIGTSGLLVAGDFEMNLGAFAFTGSVVEKKRFGLVLVNSSGTALQNIRAYLKNTADTEQFNLLSDSSGVTTETKVTVQSWTGATPTKTDFNNMQLRLRAYGYVSQTETIALTAPYRAQKKTMATNTFVVASEATAAAYTGVAINGSAKTITLSGARTVQEVYDYCQAWADDSGNIQYDEPITTVDGQNFALTTGWRLIPAGFLTYGSDRITGGTVQLGNAGTYSPVLGTTTIDFTGASGTYVMGAADITGTVTLVNTGGGSITVELASGVSYVNTGPNITVSTPQIYQSVTLSGLTVGSRVQIYDTTSSTELANAVATGGNIVFSGGGTIATWTDPTPASASRDIRLRVSRVSGVTAKHFIEASIGTCGTTEPSNAVSYLVSQTDDDVYIANAVDGSAVTGITFTDAATDLVNINLAGGASTWQDIYAAFAYWMFTSTGIADDIAYVDAVDAANYLLTSMKLKNTSSPTVALTITGGYGRDATSGTIVDIVDTTGGSIFPLVDHVVNSVVTVGGVNIITGDIADVAAEVQSGLTTQGYTTTRASSLDKALTTAKFLGLK